MAESEDNFQETLLRWGRRLQADEAGDVAREIGKQKLLEGVPLLISLLDHPDPIVRHNAAVSLSFNLSQKNAREVLIRMATEDDDEDNRRAAAAGLGHLFRNSRDPHLLSVLGKLALSDPDYYVRKPAYKSLLIVHGVTNEEHLNLLTRDDVEIDPARVAEILRVIAPE